MSFNIQEHSSLKPKPSTTSDLQYAVELQQIAAKQSFEWLDIKPVFEKLFEEIDELKAEIIKKDKGIDAEKQAEKIQDELGDVLFCCVNLARFLKIDPEKALAGTNDKFRRRFQFIEERLYQDGLSVKDSSLEVLDQIWDQAKEEGL
mgnify:CR=1 FL=1